MNEGTACLNDQQPSEHTTYQIRHQEASKSVQTTIHPMPSTGPHQRASKDGKFRAHLAGKAQRPLQHLVTDTL
eukprot:scaffold382153_cov21-Prasinocladus_malaysianus.AAC.1